MCLFVSTRRFPPSRHQYDFMFVIVLIGAFLAMSPDKCKAQDDEPVVTTPVGPLGVPNATNHVISTTENVYGRRFRYRGVIVSPSKQASCVGCNSPSCFDPNTNSTTNSSEKCLFYGTNNVTCYSWQRTLHRRVVLKGEPVIKPTVEKGCLSPVERKCLEMAMNILTLDYSRGSKKCVKGFYSDGVHTNYAQCVAGNGQLPPDTPLLPDRPPKYSMLGEAQRSLMDHPREEYGIDGKIVYQEHIICACGGEKCNTHIKDDLNKAVDSNTATLERGQNGFGVLILTILGLLVATHFLQPQSYRMA